MIGDGPGAQVKDAVLAGLLEQLDAVVLDARALTDSLTREQMNWQPAPGRWSIAQCLDHITRSVRLYPAEIERMIGTARTRAAAGVRPYREGWLSRWVVSGLEPPPKLRVRTTGQVEPAADHEPAAVAAEFAAAHARLRELIVAADGVPLRHARMRSPFLRLLRFTLGQVLAMNLAHARRHLWQARQVRQQASFPEAPTSAAAQIPR